METVTEPNQAIIVFKTRLTQEQQDQVKFLLENFAMYMLPVCPYYSVTDNGFEVHSDLFKLFPKNIKKLIQTNKASVKIHSNIYVITIEHITTKQRKLISKTLDALFKDKSFFQKFTHKYSVNSKQIQLTQDPNTTETEFNDTVKDIKYIINTDLHIQTL